jgi:TRAP-type C4-dicarboxylate transport system substrate-binding protein
MMKKTWLALSLLACLAASPASAAEELSYQSFWGAAHALNKTVIEPWCAGLAKATDGAFVMHYNALNTLIKADAMPTAIRNGSLEAGGIQMQTAVSMMPLSQLLSLPFLVQNAEEACIMAQKMYETFPEVRAEIDANFKLLALAGSDRYAFVATRSLIKTPADLAGKRVLIWAPYQIEEVKAWGGIPVQITSSETYMGLQRGLGEVAYVPAPSIESNKLSEVGKFLTLIPSRSLPLAILMNKEIWASLSPAAQKYFTDTTGDVISRGIGTGLVQLTAEDNTRHVTNGCTLYELTLEEQAAFRDSAAEANRTYWMDMLSRNNVQNPAEWIAKVEKLAAETFGR